MQEEKQMERRKKIAVELSDLVVYCRPVPFNEDKIRTERACYRDMSSFPETKAEKFATRARGKRFLQYNRRQLSRVYPRGQRLDSSNYDPLPMWLCGSQLVALNFQTPDKPMQLNQALFMLGGSSGFVPQPDIMRDDTFDPFDKDTLHVEPITIQLQKQFVFDIHNPTFSFLRFTVYEEDMFSDPNFLAQATYPVRLLRTGYRSILLKNSYSEELELASLLVHIEIVNAKVGAGSPTVMFEAGSKATRSLQQRSFCPKIENTKYLTCCRNLSELLHLRQKWTSAATDLRCSSLALESTYFCASPVAFAHKKCSFKAYNRHVVYKYIFPVLFYKPVLASVLTIHSKYSFEI
ncbi:hypothetical protein XENOCAPTIV_016795 [Xenoophorus captivus]|uniref:Phosphoinositide phospholipase C n=1 Tax=Xenoophorus captivus TaxID=1517983 RepID=A0ABV0S479_9TELE